MIELFPRRGEAGIFSKHQLPGNKLAVHDVIDIKCIKNSYLNEKCTIIVGSWCSAPDPILGPHDLQTVGGWMIKNRNFHQTQFPGNADTARNGRL